MDMFGDIFGNMQQKQEEMQKKLAQVIVKGEAGDGAVLVKANALREVLDIKIDKAKLSDASDLAELEDLLVEAVNRALDEAAEKASSATNDILKDLLPDGLV
jgi:DNA-binding YbaB/EbfC family protein